MSSELSYLAAPYSDPDKSVVGYRMHELLKADADLTVRYKKITVTPLSKHFILPFGEIPSDWNYWERYSKRLLDQSIELIIIGLSGWTTSSGVIGEIEYARTLKLPIFLYDIRTREIRDFV